MIRISRENLSSEQVNDIILLVNNANGKVYSAGENGLELDLTKLSIESKREIAKSIIKLKKKK